MNAGVSEIIVKEDGTIKSPVAHMVDGSKVSSNSMLILAWGPQNSVLKTLGKIRTDFAQISGLLDKKDKGKFRDCDSAVR